LVIVQAQSSTAELFPKDSVLLAKVVDRQLLVLVHQPGDGD
jgi:hypothetical protein